MKETASRHVKCLKDPTMSEEESSFENASCEAHLELVFPEVEICNSHLTVFDFYTNLCICFLENQIRRRC